MTDYGPPRDFNSNLLQVGDAVAYVDRVGHLANGIIIEIVENPLFRVFVLLNTDRPSKDLAKTSYADIMYVNSNYRGMTGDYILSLHGITQEH